MGKLSSTRGHNPTHNPRPLTRKWRKKKKEEEKTPESEFLLGGTSGSASEFEFKSETNKLALYTWKMSYTVFTLDRFYTGHRFENVNTRHSSVTLTRSCPRKGKEGTEFSNGVITSSDFLRPRWDERGSILSSFVWTSVSTSRFCM